MGSFDIVQPWSSRIDEPSTVSVNASGKKSVDRLELWGLRAFYSAPVMIGSSPTRNACPRDSSPKGYIPAQFETSSIHHVPSAFSIGSHTIRAADGSNSTPSLPSPIAHNLALFITQRTLSTPGSVARTTVHCRQRIQERKGEERMNLHSESSITSYP